ncbi:glycoside hydrolase, family 28, Pectin lyase fold/virulence factor [Artemisia annua]|uniref:Glycoside hydrolase, family 28, Pectin lyase fold/virulence factor n=1 Tax=Artemisia annua TaxID=35608 RepID=A0A2U1KX67_ARTAN|nr:glycoside hydrolase, family 28, Pectin lyase fold/virulence factor [Artemisia annua]
MPCCSSIRSYTLTIIIAILVWSSATHDHTCNASRHWRHSKGASTSLSKKKSGSNHHHNGKSKSKSKSSSHKPPVSSVPAPKPKPPPASKPPVASVPAPKHNAPSPPPENGSNGGGGPNAAATYNVMSFGAKGDGITDDTKAFEGAWAAACKVKASKIIVPSPNKFLVGPITFSGPYCQPNIVFQVDGTIVAPSSFKPYGSGLFQWILFTKLVGLTIQGGGTIDGSGSIWWKNTPLSDPLDDELKLIVPINGTHQQSTNSSISSSLGGQMPSIKPTALRFYGSFDVTVTGITIQNSPQCHLKFDNCVGVSVYNFKVSSPADSPNTDGIHLQNSKSVLIHTTDLSCGDDCVSIQTGCSDIYVHNVNCGPGHGISIGSLGKDNTKACVSNVTIRDIMMHNTMNGVRIKTWQGGSGSVQGIMFSNIQVSEVQLPIVIDQYYCDKQNCRNQSSAVALSGISYERIRGTYTVKPVHLACSDSMPCTDVHLNGINLKPVQEKYHLYDPFCWKTFGELLSPAVPPVECLQIGKPSSSHVQADHDMC